MPLAAFLPQLRSLKATITRKALTVLIQLPPATINQETLSLLNRLLNACEPRYFIVLTGLPPCLMPNAKDHILLAKGNNNHYRRISACRKCAILSTCPGWNKGMDGDPDNILPIKDIPSEIVVEVTGQCNLSCQCCTSESKRDLIVPLKTIDNIVLQTATLGIQNIRFTGGEPLLHPQLPDMLTCARSRKLYVLLNTNATLLTPMISQFLARTTDNILVSLQGFNETSDQKLTSSRQSFKHKVNNILLLRKHVPTVRIGTVITRILVENLPDYAKLIRALGVDSWELFRPLTMAQNDLTHISHIEYRKLALQAMRLRASGINIKLANALPFCLFADPRTSTSVMLGAESDDGHSRLVWDPRGFFKPSYFITRDLGRNIQDAWAHPFLKELRSTSYLPQECRSCDFFAWCKGGSRSAAHNAYGTCFSKDPLFLARPKNNLRIA